MKIILVRPFNKFAFSYVPALGLGYLSSMLKVKGNHEVLLYDAARDRISSIGLFKTYLSEHDPHVVGIQLCSTDLLTAREYLRLAKRYNPEIITVLGGPHPSACPDETMNYFGTELLDFIIAGEGELGFLALVNSLEQGGRSWEAIPGLAWRDEYGAISKNANAVVEDLDTIPYPDWELLDPAKNPYVPLGGFSKNFPMAPILVSRGCPLQCTFCAAKSIYGKGFRFRDIDQVIGEVKYLQERFGVKEIMILDDNIAYRKDLFLELCEKIRPLNIDWNCLNGIRLDFVDEELVKAMKEARCYAVSVGIESGSQKILNDMNKKLTIEFVSERINMLAKYKIRITGLFIIGYPTETREDILKTIRFAKRLKIDRAAFVNFLPLPGSAIFDELKKEGRLRDLDLGNLSYYKVTRSFSPYLSTEELDALLKMAIRSFYLRPSIIFKALCSVGSVSDVFYLAKKFIQNYTV